MMFAEISNGEIAMTASTVGLFVVALIALNKKQDVKLEQPVSITITEELHKVFASKENFEKHVEQNNREHENLHSKIGGVDRGNGSKLTAEVAAIHTRINAIEKSVGGMEATNILQNQKLANVETKVDNVPSKVIEILDRTGQLKK